MALDPRAVEEIARELTRELLAVRVHGAAPLDPHLRQRRKDIGRGRAKPCAMITEILISDLADGTPLARVEQWPLRLLGMLRAFRPSREPRSLPELQELETRADARLDLAQLRIAGDHSLSALAELETAALEYAAVHTELLERVRIDRLGTVVVGRISNRQETRQAETKAPRQVALTGTQTFEAARHRQTAVRAAGR